MDPSYNLSFSNNSTTTKELNTLNYLYSAPPYNSSISNPTITTIPATTITWTGVIPMFRIGERVCIKQGFENEGKKYTYKGASMSVSGRVVLQGKEEWNMFEVLATTIEPCPFTAKEIAKKFGKKYDLDKKAIKELRELIEG